MALTVNTNIINDTDQYLLDAKNVKGGYVVVATVADMNNLPAATTVQGSLCFCVEGYEFYQYDGSSWVKVKLVTTKTSELTDDIGFAKNADLAELQSQAITSITNKGSEISYTQGVQTKSFNTTFVGARAAYTAAYDAGNIPVGTIVILTDEPDEDEPVTDGATSSVLGQGVLGYLILG